MEVEFIMNPVEEGFVIVISENDNNFKYIGKDCTIAFSDILNQAVENEKLDKLALFESDEDGICEAVNDYRMNGINARMFSVFKATIDGHRILDCDETEKYIKYNFIVK